MRGRDRAAGSALARVEAAWVTGHREWTGASPAPLAAWRQDMKKPKDSDVPKMKNKEYVELLRELQVELCHMQEWAKEAGARIILLFEGRDAAGKGGIIKAITERVSARVFKVVALTAPTEREKTQLFMQRYIQHFPAAGEILILDRSWYNRAGVEYVMGFCTKEEHQAFLENCPGAEQWIIDSGIILIKVWLEVGKKEQERRFHARITDPLRQWKLSPMDTEAFKRWYAYSKARDLMLEATDRPHSPWHILRSDDKKRARLNGISHILSLIPYEKIDRPLVKLPKRSDKGKYDDELKGRRFIPAKY